MGIQPFGNVTQGSATQSGPPAPAAHDPSNQAGGTTVATGTAPTQTTAAVAAVQAEPSSSQVSQALQKINAAMAAQSQGIEFSIDPASHHVIINIVDQQTNQVIRQIPSKEALAIAGSLDQTQGLLIKQQA